MTIQRFSRGNPPARPRHATKASSRRQFIGCASSLGAAAVAAPWLTRCDTFCEAPIDWIPTALAPVFYGYRDWSVAQGAPCPLRVFYPSLEGAPENAPLLTCRGVYRLVLFLHGECAASPPDHQSWFQLPATLARSGFVVVAPDLSWASTDYPWQTSSPQHALASSVVDWMRAGWPERTWLADAASQVLVGHSWGALLAGYLALSLPSAALVALGGTWTDVEALPSSPLPQLPVPSLFLSGSDILEAFDWSAVPSPTHRVTFAGGSHWDFFSSSVATCGTSNGPCPLVADLSADLTTLFLSRLRVGGIPDSLEPPPVTLSGDQIFYAGNHLTSFDRLPQAGCTTTIEWKLPATGSVTLPW